MSKIIDNFKYFSGVHCGSTSLFNIARYYGHNLSEAMCFGLGSGLGFFYHRNEQFSPSIIFHGRCRSLESYFFKNLGVNFRWHKDEDFPWEKMITWIDKNVPVLILTDLYYLDYYHTNTHFGGHTVVLVGYNTKRGVALLVDTERKELQETSIPSLAKAMSSKEVPYPLYNYWSEVPFFTLQDLSGSIKLALALNCRKMLLPQSSKEGVSGMEEFIKEIPLWRNLKDFSWCAKYAYQVIERRGTGGGGFRALYAEYLEEAKEILPILKEINADTRMAEIASKWTELAFIFKDMSENGLMRLEQAASLAMDIFKNEKVFFQDVHGLLFGTNDLT
ncbi:BtrH N-terminal domain-containing protein [Desulfoscipio geothermicus]|uniref:Butirosin biosynthesis protein H, N-terminal n=1 Tax=Desulfoscipio geothermicus DSM 3669 TaxID=1121426 RepID=A0A1I6CQG7_9FIRM|nr:BtrH N-terminal domain-containing protein [Desulfoscipio geothermicus]SFQ95436.1 Butirosin biosynthesis protein H, N-terminal [Desulfoscipio geothermicus DSM 3669]